MIIPHTETPREDTGLYNGKAGIWLFLASEVMLFGALFSAYVLLRVGADDGTWSMGLMNKWVGAFNTLILIASSATIVLAWVSLKLRDFDAFRKWKWITIGFATAFLVVKWCYEWPAKFTHYDITFTSEEAAKKAMGSVLGGFDEDKVKEIWEGRFDPHKKRWDKVALQDKPLDGHIVGYIDSHGKRHKVGKAWGLSFWSHAFCWRHDRKNLVKDGGQVKTVTETVDGKEITHVFYNGIEVNEDGKTLKRDNHGNVVYQNGAIPYHDSFRDRDIAAVIIHPDPKWLAKHKHARNGRLQFAEEGSTGTDAKGGGHSHEVVIPREDISRLSSYEPAHSTFFATYYTLTGLHALHVFGGILVMLYHLLPISRRVYESNPEQFTNRIEVTGLFWHFVDLVWIFLFPILYLM